MKILCLYQNDCAVELFEWLRDQGHITVPWTKQLDPEWCRRQDFDLAVSYTYRHILSAELLNALGNNAVNIHNSYLPWNRGAAPNIWSILEDTPRGVTLHYMNEKLDRGSIIAQQLVAGDCSGDETLASTYSHLDCAAKKLFKDAFAYYGLWKEMRKEASGKGSYHSLSDTERLKGLFDTYLVTVSEIKKKYAGLKT